VDGDGIETALGPVASITLATYAAVDISNIPIADDRSAPVRQRNIYRTLAGAPDEPPAYLRVAEIYDNTTTTWRDRVSDTVTAVTTALQAAAGGVGNVEAGSHV